MKLQKIENKKRQSIFKRLSGYLPITRKAYYKDLRETLTAMEGLIQEDAHHSQIEQNLISAVSSIEKRLSDKAKKNNKNNSKKDIAYM